MMCSNPVLPILASAFSSLFTSCDTLPIKRARDRVAARPLPR
jgi:hypothetical protein